MSSWFGNSLWRALTAVASRRLGRDIKTRGLRLWIFAMGNQYEIFPGYWPMRAIEKFRDYFKIA